MGLPQFTVAVGTIDGVNTLFSTPAPYIAGTLAVFLNGQLLRQDSGNGWEELVPGAGTFQTDVPPEIGDSLQVFFINTSTGVTEEVTFLEGRLESFAEVRGEIEPDLELPDGMIELVVELHGTITVGS